MAAVEGLRGFDEGSDLSNDLGLEWTADGQTLLYVRSKALADGRAAGVTFLTDGPFCSVLPHNVG